MKIRSGFVSNSSSSSFLIYGIRLGKSEAAKLFLAKAGTPSEAPDDDEDFGADFYEIDQKITRSGLDVGTPSYDEDCYIGLSWSKVGDTETGGEFKERVRTKLAAVLGEELPKLSTHEEAWYNG